MLKTSTAPVAVVTANDQATQPSAFAPMDFVRQIIDAVEPLLHDDGTSPLLRVPFLDLYDALVPFFGNYTVADAVIAHHALDLALSVIKDDDRTQGSLWYAMDALERFACSATASSADCAAARARFLSLDADAAAEGEVLLADVQRPLAHQRLQCDIGDLRRGRFDGERFGSTRWMAVREQASQQS